MSYKEAFMKKAITLAHTGKQQEGGGAFGAVITKDGKEIASCYNAVSLDKDPTQHAELKCIQLACKLLKTKSLQGCILYASCEPCTMCLGASGFAGIDIIYFGASVEDAAQHGYSQLPVPYENDPQKRHDYFNMHQKMRDEALQVWK